MTGPYSGKWGVVNGESTVRDWSINDTMEPKPYVASNTQFGQGEVRGVESWDGNYNQYGSQPTSLAGDLLVFLGYGAPLNNAGGSGWRYAGNAYVESNVITWNWGTGDILSHVTNFKGHNNLTAQGAAGAQIFDHSVPDTPPIGCTKWQYSENGTDWTDYPNLVQAVLTLTCELKPFVNSSTLVMDGDICRIWTGHLPGPVKWTAALTEQNVDRALFVKGQVLWWRGFVNDDEYYEMKWGMVENFTGIVVNRNGDIVQQTVNIGMDGFDRTAGSYGASIGHVILPDGTLWWPFGSGS